MYLLQSGVNLVYIRDLLGHADVSTTEVYARADEKMKREALENACESPSDGEMPAWQKDSSLLDWLKKFGKKVRTSLPRIMQSIWTRRALL